MAEYDRAAKPQGSKRTEKSLVETKEYPEKIGHNGNKEAEHLNLMEGILSGQQNKEPDYENLQKHYSQNLIPDVQVDPLLAYHRKRMCISRHKLRMKVDELQDSLAAVQEDFPILQRIPNSTPLSCLSKKHSLTLRSAPIVLEYLLESSRESKRELRKLKEKIKKQRADENQLKKSASSSSNEVPYIPAQDCFAVQFSLFR